MKTRDLSWVIYIGVVIEIRMARSDRNAAKFYGYPYFTFYSEEIFCAHGARTIIRQVCIILCMSQHCLVSSIAWANSP